MNVIKIGGSVLKNKAGFESFLKILSIYKGKQLVVVISGFNKVTTELGNCAKQAVLGHTKKASHLLDDIFDKNKKIASTVIEDIEELSKLNSGIDLLKHELSTIIKSVALTRELSARVKDSILAYGEILALEIIRTFLSVNQIRHSAIDAVNIFVADESYGRAKPIESDTEKKINKILIPALKDTGLVITQGFIAKSKKGNLTTMGIESSNLTAALLAKILKVNSITYWTDVSGIHSCDPALVPNSDLIKNLNYSDAYLYGSAGLKLIYPEMINYVRKNNIKLIFRSAFDNMNQHTVVRNGSSNRSKILLYKSGRQLVKISPSYPEIFSVSSKDIADFINAEYHNIDLLRTGSGETIIVNSSNGMKFNSENYNIRIIPNVTLVSAFNVESSKFLHIISSKTNRTMQVHILYLEYSDKMIKLVIKDKYLPKILNLLYTEL